MCLSAYPENYMVVPAFSPCPWVAMPPMPLAHMMPYPAAHMSMTPRKKQQYQQETGKTAKAAKATKAPKAPKVAKDFSEPLPTLPLTPSTAPPTPCSILLEDSEGESDHKCEKNSSDAALNRASRRRVRQRLRKKEGKVLAAMLASGIDISELELHMAELESPLSCSRTSTCSTTASSSPSGSGSPCPPPLTSYKRDGERFNWSDVSEEIEEEDALVKLPGFLTPAQVSQPDEREEEATFIEYYVEKVSSVPSSPQGRSIRMVPLCATSNVEQLVEKIEVELQEPVTAYDAVMDAKLPDVDIAVVNTFVQFAEPKPRALKRRNSL